MAKKKVEGNGKKLAGNAIKATAAATKAAAENLKKSQAMAEEWSKGAKSQSKA